MVSFLPYLLLQLDKLKWGILLVIKLLVCGIIILYVVVIAKAADSTDTYEDSLPVYGKISQERDSFSL